MMVMTLDDSEDTSDDANDDASDDANDDASDDTRGKGEEKSHPCPVLG